jgi:hypothetical protein
MPRLLGFAARAAILLRIARTPLAFGECAQATAARLAILRVVEARRRNPPLSSFTAAEALRRTIEPFFLRRGGHGQRRQ